MEKQPVSIWLFIVCLSILSLVLFSFHKGYSQTRDEETAKEMEQYNPWQAPKSVIDNTVNQVLPFQIPTDSKIAMDERACFEGCAQERDRLLQESASELDRGHAWAQFQKCKSECPEKVANQNRAMEQDVFNKEERYPAGSAPSIDEY